MDITFDLKSDTYYPHRKLNNELQYINERPKHPPSIINQIQSMISKRVSEDSYHRNYFYEAALDSNIFLKDSEFHDNVIYIPNQSKRQSRNRQII